MSRFVQLHMLTSYPPSNLNRDDLGSPKTAVMGGYTRLRISSQSLKRAWRTSDIFKESLDDHIGKRTKLRGSEIYKKLIAAQIDEKKSKKWAEEIAEQFGKLKSDKKNIATVEQLVHFSPEEDARINELTELLIKRKKEPTKEELKELMKTHHTAADIALFGRMLASHPDCNTEAAAQVAHAISVHKVSLEDDFFSAIDDLNAGDEHSGAGHIGVSEFSAGLYYLYICIDKELLKENLFGDKDLCDKTLKAFVEASVKVPPTGKQNSFASRAYASYLRCESGEQPPRSLSIAFLKPVTHGDMLKEAIKKLEKTADSMDNAYGKCYRKKCEMNVADPDNKTKLKDIIDCVLNGEDE